jgi:uncharacterized protein YbcC (UPF0753/DUF2309 family)
VRKGFYAAWRQSAGSDWAWELDEFAGARHDIEQLPDDPLQAISSERLRLGLSEAHWEAYLQRLALELPGWAGMFAWRESHAGGGDAPVSLADSSPYAWCSNVCMRTVAASHLGSAAAAR